MISQFLTTNVNTSMCTEGSVHQATVTAASCHAVEIYLAPNGLNQMMNESCHHVLSSATDHQNRAMIVEALMSFALEI